MRASLKDRILAKLDRLLTRSTMEGDSENGGRLVEYRTGIGRKMLILDENNGVQSLGNSMWVTHEYDRNGNLIRRTVVRKDLKPGWRVIYGHKKVYEAYDKYGKKYPPTTGVWD